MFACRIGDKEVRLDDLPMSVYADIEEASGVPWFDLIDAPARSAKAGPLLIARCAAHLGAEPPEDVTPRSILGFFVLVGDDLPVEFEDGIPPEGEGSSTAG